jgi:hypothetical protein
MNLDIAQINLDMACETGNHVLFMRAMYEIFRAIPLENVYSITLTQAEICLETTKLEQPKETIHELLTFLWNTSPYFHIDESEYKPLDLVPFNNARFYYFFKAVNELLEAATKTDTHWQRSLLKDAYQRMTYFRIFDYRHSTFANTKPSDTWNMPEDIEFRKSIFRDFKRTLTIEYGLF